MNRMKTQVVEKTGEIRGVGIRWVDILVAEHVVEQVLSFEVAEAEAVYGRPFDDEMDRHIQMGMFAKDRIALDGTMHRVASTVSYVLGGRCIRTAKIRNCNEIEPMSTGWKITKPDGTTVEPVPWSCVGGTPPLPHHGLTLEDNVTRFLRAVSDRAQEALEEELRPDRTSGWAGAFGKGHRFFHLWYSSAPWSLWKMSYRIDLHRGPTSAIDANWLAEVSFAYRMTENEGLDWWLSQNDIQGQSQYRDDGNPASEDYSTIKVSLDGDTLSEDFATQLAATLTNLIQSVTPAVEAFELERSDRDDEVTHFLRSVAALVVDGLPDGLRPDRNSEWADRSGDRRFLQLWNSREPWNRKGMSYGINLFPPDEPSEGGLQEAHLSQSAEVPPDSTWEGSVDFSYWGCGDQELKTRIEHLRVHEDQTVHLDVISVHRRSPSLDETYANELAETAMHLIRVITPAVDEFQIKNGNEANDN